MKRVRERILKGCVYTYVFSSQKPYQNIRNISFCVFGIETLDGLVTFQYIFPFFFYRQLNIPTNMRDLGAIGVRERERVWRRLDKS